MRRKFLSVLLAASMVLTLLPTAAWAEGENKLTLELDKQELSVGDEEKTAKLTINGTVGEKETLSTESPVAFSLQDSDKKEVTGKITAGTGNDEVKIDNTTLTGAATLDYSGLAVGTYTATVTVTTVVSDTTGGGGGEEKPAAEGDTTKEYIGTVSIEIKEAEEETPATEFSVGGTVSTATGLTLENLAGITVKLYGKADTNFANALGTGTTDAQGKYTIGTKVENGEYVAVVEASDGKYQKATKNVTVDNGDVSDADIELQAEEPANPDPITEVTITLAKPVTGTAANDVPGAETADATYEVTTTTWAAKEGSAALTGKVKGETAYVATVTLTAKNTTFAEDVTVKDVAGAASTTKGELGSENSTLTVTVEFAKTDAATLAKLEITTAPTKTTYKVGETFEPAGMVVKAVYNDDAENATYEDYTCEVADPLTADITKVIIKDKTNPKITAEQAITVNKNQVALTIETPTASGITYGQPLSESTITTGTVTDSESKPVTGGSWAWKDGTTKLEAGSKTATAVYTPPVSDDTEYTDAANKSFESDVTVEVTKAEADAIEVTVAGGYVKTDASLPTTANGKGVVNETVAGSLAWYKDEAMQEEISGGTGAFTGKNDGDVVKLYWKFTPTGSNYDGAKTGSADFTVTSKIILVFAFTETEKAITYTENGTVTNALKMTADGTDTEMNTVTGLTVVYSSDSTDVATVAESGLVTLGTKAGTAVITATISGVPDTHVCDNLTVSYTLTVNKADAAKPAALTGSDVTKTSNSITITTSEAGKLYAVVAGAAPADSSAWKAGTGSALTFGGLSPETAYNVYVKTAETDTHNESVTSDALAVTTETAPAVNSLTLNKNTLSLKVGGSETLVATVDPEGTPVTWTSSNNTIATVDTAGKVTAKAAGTATITAAAGELTATCTVTVSAGGGGSSSGGSSGGGGGGGAPSSSVTVPVSGNDKSVEVSAKVSGSTAVIDKIDGLDKVIDGNVETGVVEIDLTALKKDINTVKLPAAALEDIAEAAADSDNDVDGLAIKLDSGTIEFDADALEAIADQASGSTIELKLEKTNANSLNSSQKDAVKDMEIHGHFDLTLNGGKVITSFKGGRVTVRIPFAVPSGKEAANFVVIYAANDGSVEEMRTNCSGGYISFTTDHFSKYMIAYKAAEPIEPVEETPVTADCDGGSSCPAHKFTDVNTSLWYHKAVDYAITNSLMSGVGENTFSPNANLSRAMLAQILYNLAGRPAVTGSSDFNDVADGMWYTNAITWAAENGVVSGLGNGKFGPNDNITREQLAVMLYRYADSPAAGGSLDGFADAGKVSGYAQNGLVWATSNGVMSGKGGGMLDPQGLATRAEVAQMLYNYLNR